jgi:hypothetical protein
LFAARAGESTPNAINNQLVVLMQANKTDATYLSVIVGGENMDDKTLSSYETHMLRQKCYLLCCALNLALTNMNDGWTWNKCLRGAIATSKLLGFTCVENPRTVERW